MSNKKKGQKLLATVYLNLYNVPFMTSFVLYSMFVSFYLTCYNNIKSLLNKTWNIKSNNPHVLKICIHTQPQQEIRNTHTHKDKYLRTECSFQFSELIYVYVYIAIITNSEKKKSTTMFF
jgi:hypothetical protein